MKCWVYVANAASREVFALALDDRGALTRLGRYPVAGEAMPIAVSPDRRLLFVALRSPPFGVASFAIDGATGRLAPIDVTPLPASMCYLATDRSGRFLLSAGYFGHLLAVNRIAEKGAVVAEPEAIVEHVANAHAVIADPSNKFLFATSLGSDRVLQFSFDAATGNPVPNDPAHVASASGAGPRHLAFHPTGRWLYVINELNGSLAAYDFDAARGVLRQTQVLSALPPGFTGKPWAADLRVAPDGRFLFGSERGSNTIACYAIDGASGRLALRGHCPTETQPRGIAVDPGGRFLLAAGQVSNHLTVYAIDGETGALKPLNRYAMGDDPNWIEIVNVD